MDAMYQLTGAVAPYVMVSNMLTVSDVRVLTQDGNPRKDSRRAVELSNSWPRHGKEPFEILEGAYV
jgi:hypothetical protein